MNLKTILLVMKLTTVILIFALVQVSAKSFSQKITLNEKNAPLEKVLNTLKQQSGYIFFYDDNDIKQNVTIRIQDATIEDALNATLKTTELTYKISEKTIFLTKKEPSLLDKIKAAILAIDVTGRILDEKGLPIPGATIQTKDGKQVTATDGEGRFVLKGVDQNAVIVVTVIGYEKKEIAAAANLGDIKLVMATSKLEEVKINAGYYSVTDRERTGSIDKITAATIEKQPVNNPLMALQNRITGLQISQQTGVPGGGFVVQIRGQNSISSGNDPLYIIDGVNYPSTRISGSSTSSILGAAGASPLSLLNPNDIESIEVLKDADATAIYGSRGANGVILISTKKAKSGNTKVDLNLKNGVSSVAHQVDVFNTQQYLQMRREAFKNDGLQPGASDFDVNGTWDQSKYTNWQKELIGKNAQTLSASFNVGGGTDNSNYLVGGNYYKEGTVMPGDFGFKRISLRSSINLKSTNDRFSASFTANYSNTVNKLIASSLTPYILLPPNQPDSYDQYGKLNWSNNTVQNNPMSLLLQTNDATTDDIVGNLDLSYKIAKNLSLRTSLGYTSIKRQEIQENPLTSYAPINGYTSAQRVSLFSNNFNNTWIAEPILSYNLKLNAAKIDALVGTSFQDNTYQINTIRAADFTSDDLLGNIGSAANLTSNQSDYSKYRYNAFFTRFAYNLKDRYYINLTGRRDGSSRFGPGKQFSNFGAIGAAWVFSEEPFIKKHLTFLSFGKLRSSYGITGNDQIRDYGYLQLWTSTGTYQGGSTLTPGGFAPNADFAWEKNKKAEGAIQLGFLKDKIILEISYYQNTSSNQLLNQNLPLSSGLSAINVNLPAEIQNSGWEFNSNFKLLSKGALRWSSQFNLTMPKNKLLSYPGLQSSANSIAYQVGQPLSILKTYNVSVNRQTGLYVFEDVNGNGSLDNADRNVIKFIGQSYYGGLQNSLRYNQFNFDFLLSFTKQTAPSYRATLMPQNPGRWLADNPNNQVSEVLTHWRQPGDESLIQRYSTVSANNSLNTNAKSLGNISIVDASYIRLKNISLSYSITPQWLKFLNISNASISIQGQNILTITNYIGLDPETTGLNIPPLRTLLVGLNLTF